MKDKYRLGGGFEMIHFKFKKVVKFRLKLGLKRIVKDNFRIEPRIMFIRELR